MHQWDWHDFEKEDNSSEPDELDPYQEFTKDALEEYVIREFWIGSEAEGFLYTIVFNRVYDENYLRLFIGDAKYDGNIISIPENGAWIVTFGLADDMNFDHVKLNPRQKKDLILGVASALYDHYNVSKSGLYLWKASRPILKRVYNKALGFEDRETLFKFKSIPLTQNFKDLGDTRRGYAIITKYY